MTKRGGRPGELTAWLYKDLSRSILAGHPWVYRDALQSFDATAGQVVTLRDRDGRLLARGIAEEGKIALRLWTTRDEPIDASFVRERVSRALTWRRRYRPAETDALRLINGEGDRLGGVVCDRYGDYLVLSLDGSGPLVWKDAILSALLSESETKPKGVLLRHGRRGAKVSEVIEGEIPEGLLQVHEYGMALPVDLRQGQKTGLFLDHRESRRQVRELAADSRVLNLYGYTGGFSIAAGLGGARAVDTVDVAEGALSLARRGWEDNGLDPSLHETHAQDVPRFLEQARADEKRWDLIISDPPSFAPKEDAKANALKAYRALHRACLKQLSDGGLYLAASCSSHVHRDAFEQTVKDGAHKAKRILQVIGRWGAAPDHPHLLSFPEGDYLTVLLCRAWGPKKS